MFGDERADSILSLAVFRRSQGPSRSRSRKSAESSTETQTFSFLPIPFFDSVTDDMI